MRGEGAGDSRYSSRPTLTSAPRIAAPRPQSLTRGPLPRHHPLLSRQLLERRPRQVHGLRVVPGATAQRLLLGLRCRSSSLLPAAVAHLGGRPEPGPCAGTAFRLPGLETVPQERKVYHPHRGDRRGRLSWRGADPVTGSAPCQEEASPTHHSFIHSLTHSGASPCLPDSQPEPARLLQPQGCGRTGVG